MVSPDVSPKIELRFTCLQAVMCCWQFPGILLSFENTQLPTLKGQEFESPRASQIF